MRFVLAMLLLWLPAADVAAGAWPREKGQGFLSFSHTLSDDPDQGGSTTGRYTALFAEYGLARSWTLGFDAGYDSAYSNWSALAFLRRRLGNGTGPNVWAAEIGLGATGGSGLDTRATLRPAFSWGRGLENGWAAVDASVTYFPDTNDHIAKVDLTRGFKSDDNRMWIVQLQAGDYPGADPYLRLAPSYVLSPKRFGGQIEFGLQIGLVGDRNLGLKLGRWLTF